MESRQAADGRAVRRRRECVSCAHRFTTFERLEPSLAIVRKRDGRRQEFDGAKVRAGLERAAHKLPAAEAAIGRIAEIVELEAATGGELSSRRIGELCLEGLRDADRVAYLRFATVHKQLADTEAIRAELSALDLDAAEGLAAIRPPATGRWETDANHDNFEQKNDKDAQVEDAHAPDLNEKANGRIHA